MGLRSGTATDFFSDTLAVPRGTVAACFVNLQAEGLVSRGSRGRNSGVDLTEMDVVNTLLALTLEVPRGQSAAAAVRHTRALERQVIPTIEPSNLLEGLTCFFMKTAGLALDHILVDFRTGFVDRWVDGEADVTFYASINPRGGSVSACSTKPRRTPTDFRTGYVAFGKLPAGSERPLIERGVMINFGWFQQVTELMGPRPHS